MGEAKRKALKTQKPVVRETFWGRIHVERDPAAAVTPLRAALLYRVPEGERSVRRLGQGFSSLKSTAVDRHGAPLPYFEACVCEIPAGGGQPAPALSASGISGV
ncbi:MAG: hypothetical protein ACYDEV_16570 [Acidiferrobacter sp.]